MKLNPNELKTRILFYCLLLVVINLLYGVALKNDDDIFDRINRNLDIFGKTYRELSLNYVDEVNIDKLMQASIEGMTGALDPYTTYYDENNKQELEMITSGKYGGIGIMTELRDSNIVISEVLSGYEAEKKGLKEGDIILELDGKSVKGIKLEKFRQLVRGEPGTMFKLKIERSGEILIFDLTRQEIILQNITYSGFVGNLSDGIGYIKLERFTMSAENEFSDAIKKLKSKSELKGLIIDLRNNGGGLLESSIGILNKLIEKNNLLLITKGRGTQSDDKYFSKGELLIAKDVPLAVLVNKGTASASEILAGAIQDLDRGVIIGEKSFGKGLVQQIKDLSYGAKLKITTKRYYTPSGRWIQEKNYFKENKSGVFNNTNIYEQLEFRTQNNRTVFAYGGITPDITILADTLHEVVKALSAKNLFFKFADYWISNNSNQTSFTFSDEIFKEFKNFIWNNNFEYVTIIEKKISELKDLGKSKNYGNSFFDNLDNLKNSVAGQKENEIDLAKNEIKIVLTNEINKRILEQSECIRMSLSDDDNVNSAISLFKDISAYNKILNIK